MIFCYPFILTFNKKCYYFFGFFEQHKRIFCANKFKNISYSIDLIYFIMSKIFIMISISI